MSIAGAASRGSPAAHMDVMESNLLPAHHTPGFPTSCRVADVLSKSIVADRAASMSWRAISEKMAITRAEAMSLAHTLVDVKAEIKASRVKW